MTKISEVDPRHLVPFARVHYHDGFDAFGMHFAGLGDGGRTWKAETNNRLESEKVEVTHTHEKKPRHAVGSKINVEFSPLIWEVAEIADLGSGAHRDGFKHSYAHGYAYLIKAVADENDEFGVE